MTSLKGESERCTKCTEPILGDRTICQCYRADIPKEDLEKMVNHSYIECFTICPDCADKLVRTEDQTHKIVLLTSHNQKYMVDKVIDVRMRERVVPSRDNTTTTIERQPTRCVTHCPSGDYDEEESKDALSL